MIEKGGQEKGVTEHGDEVLQRTGPAQPALVSGSTSSTKFEES